MVTQVEACLNSRPLPEQQSHSPDGVQPLTPGHLLIGKSLMAYPETELDLKVSQSDRWTLCQAMVQSFWRRWSKEYRSQLQVRNKWRTARPSLAVGDVVLMKDSSSFQTHWGLARVSKVFPGDDGLVRAVDVTICKAQLPDKPGRVATPDQLAVKKTTLRRPIAKLSLLVPAERDLSSGGGCSVLSPPASSRDAGEG